MKNALQNLSENAQRLYEFLSKRAGAWEGDCMEALFPKPVYAQNPEARKAFWQYEANAFGNPTPERPILLEVENNGLYVGQIFNPEPEFASHVNSYAGRVSAAYQELRKAGLANERNSGYNDYWFYLIKK